MKQRDIWHTGRADFEVFEDDTIFDNILWQTPAPALAGPAHLRATAMVFYDGAFGGEDIVVSTYGWYKGAIGLNRHTGSIYWWGNPDGGEIISMCHPAFSNEGSVVYVTNDGPSGIYAWYTIETPAESWSNLADAYPDHMFRPSPVVAPDGRIFGHGWCGGVFAVQDNAPSDLSEVWASASTPENCFSSATLYVDGSNLNVIGVGRQALIKCWAGTTGAEIWSTETLGGFDGDATIDPANGNIYAHSGGFSAGDIYVTGLDKNGNPLWESASRIVYDWQEGVNSWQRAQSTGCLSHSGTTYYFQTVSEEADGRLYAINTSDGSVKWSFDTQSEWVTEEHTSCPIVTLNDVVIVGNNRGDMFFAIKDEGPGNAILLDTLAVDPGNPVWEDFYAGAYASATLAEDGKLYIPARMNWTVGNADNNQPDGAIYNLFMCIQLKPIGNTQPGADVPVTPEDPDSGATPVDLTFFEVTESGETTLDISETGAPPKTGFKLGNPPCYYEIETTAGYSGPITICIDYAGISFGGNEENLKLYHQEEGGNWTDITSTVDTVERIICGIVDSLSTFSIFEPMEIIDLCQMVQTSGIRRGVKNSLVEKLQNAQVSATSGNIREAENQIRAFQNEVRAQSGKKIPSNLADEWLEISEIVMLNL
jgi:outer membrane protein assembly factor BamB